MNIDAKHKKGYKQTKLGLIPKEWKVVKLGELGETINGLTYSPADISKDGVLVLRSSNIQNRRLTFNDNVFVKVEEDDFNPVKTNDILVCVRNGSKSLIGKNTLITDKVTGVAFGAFMTIFRSENNFYFHHLFDTSLYKRQVHKNLGATINSINGKDFKKFIFPLPPLPEQQKIAQILSTWDMAIDKTQQLIAQLQLRKKGLMQQLLSGKKRLKGFDGEWNEYRVEDLTENFSRRNKELIDARVYSVTNSNGFVLQSNHFSREVAGSELKNHKIIKKNEYAYNPARINVGSIGQFQYKEGIISSLYVCFRTNDRLLSDYFNYLLDTDEFKYRIIQYGEGGVRIYLWYYLFKKIRVKIPSLQEQKAIAKILTTADTEIQQYQKYLTELQTQKKGLMQQLLTGKTRVKLD